MIEHTITLAVAYLSNHHVPRNEIGDTLSAIYRGLKALQDDKKSLAPAVPIEESIQDEYLVCLEDGKKLQMLKRHLRQTYNMGPEEYLEKWGLPEDYPMVAPAYARKRSQIAREQGLGRSAG